jgi:YD repeat-containing protein
MRLPKRKGAVVPCPPGDPTPPTSPTRSGGSSSLSSLKPSPAADRAPTKPGSSWTRSSTPSVPAAPGDCCPTSSRLGRPSTTTSASGASTAPLGADQRRSARARPRDGRPRSDSRRGDRGQPVGEDHGEGRRSRLRWGQEGERSQEAPAGGHHGSRDEGQGAPGGPRGS